ncbi:MAG TPA: alkaline phosphatase family protein [Acidimicrobiia bacterium]
MTIDRREFLKRAGVIGGAAAAVTALPGCRRLFPPGFNPGRSVLDGLPGDAPIDHVVVVMMENRSFDHWLGWLADDWYYLESGRHRYGRSFSVNGRQHQTFPGPSGPVATEHLLEAADETSPYQGCGHNDPGHGWDQGRAERDGGFLAPASGNDDYALGYYLGNDLPFTSQLARHSTIFDDYHAALLGPTWPNREYLHSAQSGGLKSNILPPTGPFDWTTIWDRLGAANVPAKYYFSDLPFLGLWGPRLSPFEAPVADYFTDCANGTLPNVTMVDPSFFGDTENDDHPLADIRGGQHFLHDVFSAFVNSPHWEHGVFIITYDEWGGFFDHVAPPIVPDDRASTVDEDNFGQAGFRVPVVMASPYALPGFVDHRQYDHTSILRFIEWRFLGAPPEGPGKDGDSWFLTTRDRNTANIGASLRQRQTQRDLGFDLAGITIGQPNPPCGSSAAVAAMHVHPTDEREFQTLAASGYFERVGVRVSA